MLRVRSDRGDTMIEVLLSVAIFAMVAIAGLTIMNQGSAAAQRSLEITLVRQEIDAQANTLRFMYDAALAQKSSVGFNASQIAVDSPVARWNAVLAQRKASATAFGDIVDANGRCRSLAGMNAFVMNTRTATIQNYSTSLWRDAEVYARLRFNTAPATSINRVDGLWIEAVERSAESTGAAATPGYTDFHIRACWATVGQSRPATIGTIVRLYEP